MLTVLLHAGRAIGACDSVHVELRVIVVLGVCHIDGVLGRGRWGLATGCRESSSGERKDGREREELHGYVCRADGVVLVVKRLV